MSADYEPLAGATDSVKPWTIKAIASEARDMAINAARAEGLTVGQWLERRIREWVAGAPAGLKPAVGTAELAELLSALAAVGNAAALPPAVTREAYAAVRARLRAARGLPPPTRRVPRLPAPVE